MAGKSDIAKLRLTAGQSLGTQRPEGLEQADEHKRSLGRCKFRQPANKERPKCQRRRRQALVARFLTKTETYRKRLRVSCTTYAREATYGGISSSNASVSLHHTILEATYGGTSSSNASAAPAPVAFRRRSPVRH